MNPRNINTTDVQLTNTKLPSNLNDLTALSDLSELRSRINDKVAMSESQVIRNLASRLAMDESQRNASCETAADLVSAIRTDEKSGLMEVFLTEYGLSTAEGVALMCLAEALLRVPDAETIDKLIEDKLISSSWHEHVGESPSALVNTATYGLIVTSKVLSNPSQESIKKLIKSSIKRLGAPVIRTAVKRAMKEMGHQFVLGETIESALKKGAKAATKGYTYSFDMLGEAAITQTDAEQYFHAYEQAILKLGENAGSSSVAANPGISIKLSALHPRYEALQSQRVMSELVPTVAKLVLLAKQHNLGLNIDAEEANRLDISLDVIEALLSNYDLAGWDGFGVVVQAYNKCAESVIDWLHALAKQRNQKIMLRLVKGAYWDSEIKHAQVEGLNHFPVFTRKHFTDVSYLCCAKKLLSMSDFIYPQFATHNAHTVCSIIQLADGNENYEFQRLHGMGENVYRRLVEDNKIKCRIYAPVGEHRDLLAYLVRRLLENGANSSFVNQVVDLEVPIDQVITDPFSTFDDGTTSNSDVASGIPKARDLYQPERLNSNGLDLSDPLDHERFLNGRAEFQKTKWRATSLLALPYQGNEEVTVVNPSKITDIVGTALQANASDIDTALDSAKTWEGSNAAARHDILMRIAELLEQNFNELSALLTREAGKTPNDTIAEIREAVDFLRFYAAQAKRQALDTPRGIFVCISPWNFPLAIFIGQISAALATGNGVIAKPAETTPLIAFYAIKLFYKAGVPRDVLQLILGEGSTVGAALVGSPKIAGVCFTGSTQTGIYINRSMAEGLAPAAPLIAETGGLNAMMVDSTALPEQAVKDIIKSAFQSAGQRCSALRLLYLQDDIYDSFVEMLRGAMNELEIGAAWDLSSDVGPLISAQAQHEVEAYIEQATLDGKVLKRLNIDTQLQGHYIAPTLIEVTGIEEMEKEIFAPVLHIAKFSSEQFSSVINSINKSGYGLTFGLHSRITARADQVAKTLQVGNIYINRDQIGAVVGSQPFGGENLSGTGPKAGGPSYLQRFCEPAGVSQHADDCRDQPIHKSDPDANSVDLNTLQNLIDTITRPKNAISETLMPGPTGEQNLLYQYARGIVLCLGPSVQTAASQALIAKQQGCIPIIVCPGAIGEYAIDGFLARELLIRVSGVNVIALSDSGSDAQRTRKCLAKREGAILRLVCDDSLATACVHERHVCTDTTAAGGNATLLAASM